MYASPEQKKRPPLPADPRDDVFALGVIWYQLLIGDFAAEAPAGGAWKNYLRQQRGLSDKLLDLLESCFDPRAVRPLTAAVVAERIEAILAEETNKEKAKQKETEPEKVKKEQDDLTADMKAALEEWRKKGNARTYFEKQAPNRLGAWETAAQQGNAAAQWLLAICLQEGTGAEKDTKAAAEWLRRAAETGLAIAQNDLGICYFDGIGVEKDSAEGVRWFSKAAEQGEAWAQLNLGVYYQEQSGAEAPAEAVRWYRLAAEQDLADAMIALGRCYEQGEGVEYDADEAARWYRKAAELGHPEGQDALGSCYFTGFGVEQDYSQAIDWYRKAVAQSLASGQTNLGDCYYNGKGVRRDKAEAVKWYREAAERDWPVAMVQLGLCYYLGEGVAADEVEAARWYRKAADLGHPEGQDYLGHSYFLGRGVPQDYSQAIDLYRKAADQGLASAQFNLGYCYEHGNGVKRDLVEAVKWYRMAADQEHDEAQFILGSCYEEGRVVEQDDAQAEQWYRKAADQGHKEAKRALNKLLGATANVPKPGPATPSTEKAYWVIAPYSAEFPDQFQRVWEFDLANNIISIGWTELGDISALNERRLRAAINRTYTSASTQAKGMIFGMLWDFFHSVKVGDVILARQGRKKLVGVGTVTRTAYHEPGKNPFALEDDDGTTYGNHLGIRWHDSPRDKQFPKQVFAMQTVYSIPEEKFRTLLEE